MDNQLYECLENLVGITDGNNACLSAVPENDAIRSQITRSDTGLYVDQTENLNASDVLSKSVFKKGSLWEKLLQARRLACRDIVVQVSSTMASRFSSLSDNNTILGLDGYTGPIEASAGFRSYFLDTALVIGATITFTHFGFLARLTSESNPYIMIQVFRIYGGVRTLIAQWEKKVTGSPYMPGQPDTDIYELGADQELTINLDGARYEIGYDMSSSPGFRYFANTLRCGTCPATDAVYRPFFKTLPTGSAYGMRWNIRFGCNIEYLACALTKTPVLRSLLADMIQFRTAERWLTIAMRKVGTTSDTVLNAEQFTPIRDGMGAMYLSRLDSLIMQTDFQSADAGCFVCKQNFVSGNDGIVLDRFNTYEPEDAMDNEAWFSAFPGARPLVREGRYLPYLPE